MYGGIIGDIVGSIYEWDNIKHKNFPLFPNGVFFTDDTVMTVATINSILTGCSFGESYTYYYQKYPGKGYGGMFIDWCDKNIKTGKIGEGYNSYGNGSAMRVGPIGYISNSLGKTIDIATESAKSTHNHPKGIKGAVVIAGIIFLIRKGKNKKEIKEKIETIFEYDLSRRLNDIRKDYKFDVSCQGSVPEAIISFLESNDFEDAIRNAISIGGDSDTIACITGFLAEAYYGIPESILEIAKTYLDDNMIILLDEFYEKYNINNNIKKGN